MSALLQTRIHCVGAAGAGMLPLAICLSEKGHEVSAEDDSMEEAQRAQLETAGVCIEALDAGTPGLLVRSSAINLDHPTVKAALEAGWAVARRGECLAALCEEKKLIAVVGSHGKTTTTGMLIDLCRQLGEEVSYLLGGAFSDGTAPGRWNDHEWLVAEVDESDGTIDGFSPEVAVWLNADHDHHAQYKSAEAYVDVFRKLVQRTKQVAIAPVSFSSEPLTRVGPGGDWELTRGDRDRVSARKGDERFELALSDGGAFNDLNFVFALAAVDQVFGVAGKVDRVDLRVIDRRQTCRYFSPTARVLDDYAHHPEEIRAYLESLEAASQRKRVTVFQPHRFSRTARMKEALAASLRESGRLYLLDIYAASEERCEGGEIEDLAACLDEALQAEVVRGSDETLFQSLERELKGKPVDFVFLGAGDTDRLAKAFAVRLAKREEPWGELYLEFGAVASLRSRLTASEPMARKTTLKVGGAAELYSEPKSLIELTTLLSSCRRQGLSAQVLGRGSNLIVPDSGVSGLVIRLQDPFWRRYERLDERRLHVGAGMRIKELCGLACRLEMAGFEFLEGIPGSVGGALRMNAGAMGGWMFDVVESVTFVTMSGEVIERAAESMNVGYRFCAELRDAIAVGATLRANSDVAGRQDIRSAIDVYAGKRKESQPREPSAGCIFKNPEGDSAGRLIDVLGLKGTSIGGARFSEVHGNFIVNTGGATSEDVIELVKLARRVARKEKQIELEPEALLYGASWQEALS